MKKISVIIVTYNSENHIYECLESLFKYNDICDDLEVIIVDNQSSNFQYTKSKLLNLYNSKIRIIENDKNGGYGQGNNIGIKASTAPVIMIMNPDVRLVQPIFKNVIETFSDNAVALYGLQQLKADGSRGYSISVSSVIHPLIGLPLTSVCNKMGWYWPRYMFVAGACFFVRKSSFEEVGLFDENIFMYMEEDDVQYRLSKHKEFKLLYNPHLGYRHIHGHKSKEDIKEELMILKSNLYVNTKRGYSFNTIVNREICYTKFFIVRDWISNIFHPTSYREEHIFHLKKWLTTLHKIKATNTLEI